MNDDFIAALDQMIKGTADFARLLRAFHQALVAEGFDRGEALTLTSTYCQTMMGNAGETA